MRWASVISMLLAGCGRAHFDDVVRLEGDGATGDTTPSDGPAVACAGNYDLCDGFEAPSLASYWTSVGGPALDPTMPHRGTASLHFRNALIGPGVGETNAVDQTITLPLNAPTFYVRVYVRLSARPATGNRIELVSASQTGTNAREIALFLFDQALAVYTEWTDATVDNASPAPLDTWTCLLWTVTRATTATGTIALGGDVPAAVIQNMPTDGVPGISLMSFGLHIYGVNQAASQPPIDLWMDDIIVDDAPLTCLE